MNYLLISALPLRHDGESIKNEPYHSSATCDVRPVRLLCLDFARAFSHVSNVSQGAWGYDLFQSDTDLDTLDMLNDSADLEKVKQKILANPTKYSFPKAGKSEDTGDKEADGDDDIDQDHIYMSLYNPSHPVSQNKLTATRLSSFPCFSEAAAVLTLSVH